MQRGKFGKASLHEQINGAQALLLERGRILGLENTGGQFGSCRLEVFRACTR